MAKNSLAQALLKNENLLISALPLSALWQLTKIGGMPEYRRQVLATAYSIYSAAGVVHIDP